MRSVPSAGRRSALVARELQLGIELKRLRRAELVHLHRVVDHQFGRLQRIDQLRIAAQRLHGIAHRRQVNHRGHAGEVLQQHAAGHEGDLLRRHALAVPRGQRAHVVGLHRLAVFAAQQVLQQNAQRVRQMLDRAAMRLNGTQPVNFKLLGTDTEGGATAESCS